MTTNKTMVVACRLPKEEALRVIYLAHKKDKTISEWLKPIIARAIYAGKRMKGVTPKPKRSSVGAKGKNSYDI